MVKNGTRERKTVRETTTITMTTTSNKRHVSASSRKPKKGNRQTTEIEQRNTNKIVFRVLLLVSCLKLLLIPTYRSTDFEVHRNWLAVTYSLPLKQWYLNTESQWTLDYPPLFAWFEYLLARLAKFVDPTMLNIQNFNYASTETILFQRGSVILLDLVFAQGVKEVGKVFCSAYVDHVIFAVLSLCNVGLLVVDHVHFQYNGFLLGILLLAIANVSRVNEQSSILQGTFWFALLLNLKHIYLYVAPVFAIWLLRSYCMNGNSLFKRLFALASIAVLVLIVSFGPFLSQLPQVFSRLFPFKRGLVHSYWAANAWPLYIALDKALTMLMIRLGRLKHVKSAVMTGGLVQEQSFSVLPTPSPLLTFSFTLLSIIPALYRLASDKEYATNRRQFLRCLVLCALGSFIFGWHVHEKAILTGIVPLCVLAASSIDDARVYLILNSSGHTALLPLLYPNDLTPLKILLLVLYMIASFIIFSRRFKQHVLRSFEYLYVINLPLLVVYETVLHKLIFDEQLPFLPLALTSIYCSIGVIYSWILYYCMFLRCNSTNVQNSQRSKVE
ncbi:probable dolichyl pyrophosphate Glc1Man9GlcNAc2 alpha-1,3-glucosyltransferase [Ceratina calcarata]|uniref:Alpha-1,3-glucosyltransferase n=1 Tax=Ceratina calcarata TaxID=156304 RepID=A0AAJ7J2P6_9HYME|nr:probable dolichyl pyrophosphate Glc1Man9GlcNAc2 alpha-1,3-glucosyltransferase [Ceratina calcarata]